MFQTPFEEVQIVGTTLHIVVNENAVSVDVLEGTVETYRYDTAKKTVIIREQSSISTNPEQIFTINLSLKQKFYSLFPELLHDIDTQNQIMNQTAKKISLPDKTKGSISDSASDRVIYEEKKPVEKSGNILNLEEWYQSAEILLEKEKYQESILTFSDIIKKNPHTAYAQNAYMEIARIYEKNLSDRTKSMNILKEYLEKYPQGIFVTKSKKILCENKDYQYCNE